MRSLLPAGRRRGYYTRGWRTDRHAWRVPGLQDWYIRYCSHVRRKDADEVVTLTLTSADAADLMLALDAAIILVRASHPLYGSKLNRWSTIQRRISGQLFTSKERNDL